MRRKSNIYLIGPMGSGKTAVGRALARQLGLEFLDSDAEIERRTGVDIPYIFDKEGEDGFRARERAVIADLSARRDIVLATGGGAILSKATRAVLSKTGIVVYLDVSIDEQIRRTSRSRNRPLLNRADPRPLLEQLRDVREPLYRAIADISINTSGRRVRGVASTVKRELKRLDTVPLQN